MTTTALRLIAAAALATAAIGAPAATVTLTGWAFGDGHAVQATGSTGFNGLAGAFTGSLAGAGSFNASSFVTYCIELEEHFSFGNSALTNYAVVDGASYFARRRGDAGVAERIGALMTHVADLSTPISESYGSTALQLAIWNTVYDSDHSLTTAGRFNDSSSSRLLANSLLAGAQTVTQSRFDVFALEKNGSQDFLLLKARAATDGTVPEPTSLALAAAAVGLLWGTTRRRSLQRRT